MPSQRLPPASSLSAVIVEIAQSVSGRIGAKRLSVGGGRKELEQAPGSRDPESTIGGFEELKHPRGREVRNREPAVDNRRLVRWPGAEAKETADQCCRPQVTVVILEQILKVIVRQSILPRIARGTAVRPPSIESARRRDPQRAARILQHVRHDALLGIVVRHPNRDGLQRGTATPDRQSIQPIGGASPYRAVPPFTEHRHGDRWRSLVIRHDEGEHWSGYRAIAGSDAATRPAFWIETNQPAIGGDPVPHPSASPGNR